MKVDLGIWSKLTQALIALVAIAILLFIGVRYLPVIQENEQMRQQVQRLESDPEAIEREAREKLHYTKQGEVVVAMPAQPQGK